MRQFLKYLYVFLSDYWPGKSGRRVFVSMMNRQNLTGPGRFIWNIERGLTPHGVSVERRILGRCPIALVISSAPRAFYRFCRNRGINTVLRVDGFSYPDLYDNKEHPNRDKRDMSPVRMTTNQEIQFGLKASSFVVFQSEFSRTMANRFLYQRSENFEIVYNGVDTEHFVPLQHRANEEPILLVHGTLRDNDIISCALETFRRVTMEQPARIRFVGEMRDGVRSVVQAFQGRHEHLADRISYTDKITVDDLPEVIGSADVMLHVTSGDACPNAVLEGMACGLPVVCQSWGGTAELVGPAGIAIDEPPYAYGDEVAQKLASGVLTILPKAAELGAEARQRAVDKFSIAVMTANYARVFDDVGWTRAARSS